MSAYKGGKASLLLENARFYLLGNADHIQYMMLRPLGEPDFLSGVDHIE